MRISIENAEKKFGGSKGQRALASVSLVANEGELLVLLGPSGSGKTTLLRAIAGLEFLDSGTIYFNDRRVNDLDPAVRNVGMVFQDYALYPHLSVRENIAYNMKIRRLGAAEIERRVRETAEMLGIGPYLDRKPAALSGGQRQRVAVARAITRDAQALLMDEPLSNLDAQIREHVRVELRELQRRLGVTTIYVTHDQVEAMVMADRIAVMSEGRIEQLGTADEVYDRPATLFCARFVGSPRINEIKGGLTCDGNRVVFRVGDTPGGAFQLACDSLDRIGRTHTAILAFRAEDTVVDPTGMSGEVALIENRGAEKFAVTNLCTPLRAAQVSADIRARIHRDDRPEKILRFLPSHAHLFDFASGMRLATVQRIAIAAEAAAGERGARG